MYRRGPDSNGIWQNKNYTAGFVRLSIRDLSENGSQPMLSQCGNYCLTFNGEIYNSDNYKSELRAKGVQFRSTSDTEVLLYALVHFGVDRVLREFDGMFAFAFYDQQKNELLVARDRVGIKPLYIGTTATDVIFSSQYDHIINYQSIKNNGLDYAALGNYLQLGFVPDNSGVVQNTFLLPHGHYATITSNGVDVSRYYFFTNSSNHGGFVNEEELYRQTVNEQLVSDVPVGTFLSGGVDSPLLSWWANQQQEIHAFTIGNQGDILDETDNVKQYAKAFGIKSFIKQITEKDLLDTLDDNTKAYSEPFADFSSIPSLVVSKYARQHVKVVLSGDGPDELFWGYERNMRMLQQGPLFFQSKTTLLLQYVSSRISGTKRFSNFSRFLKSKSFTDFYYRSLFTFGGDAWIKKIFKHDIQEPYFLKTIRANFERGNGDVETIMSNVRELEMNLHLQRILMKVDRASMFHSLEVRVPYLSNTILDYSAGLRYSDCVKDGIGKYNLKKMLMNKVDPSLVLKQKKGFLVPMRNWLRNEIRTDVTDKLMHMPSELNDHFNRKQIELLLKKHMVKQVDYSGIIWALYSLVNWHQQHRNAK